MPEIKVCYKAAMVGRTDRIVLVFKNNADPLVHLVRVISREKVVIASEIVGSR